MLNPIKKARLLKEMNQKELAERLGVSVVSVCKWEKGRVFPKITRLKQIADVLDTTVDNLLTDSDRKGTA